MSDLPKDDAGDDDAPRNANRATNDAVPTTVLLERLEAALLTLPRFTRDIFLAHRLEDLSYREIAERTGVSTRRVEREIARAVIAIDRALKDPHGSADIERSRSSAPITL